MMIIGCDFHPSWQQVSWLDTETGETGEQKLVTASGDAERFYREVPAPALIGMEATGNCHWLVDLLGELGHELWMGGGAQIRASVVRQQKTDKRDAEHILKLLVEGRFPRIWMPSSEVRDLRQLLVHRYKLVILRARVKNELQHLALNKGCSGSASCGRKPDSSCCGSSRCSHGHHAAEKTCCICWRCSTSKLLHWMQR